MRFCRRLADKDLAKDPMEEERESTDNNKFSVANPSHNTASTDTARANSAKNSGGDGSHAQSGNWLSSIGDNVRQSITTAGKSGKSAILPAASDLKAQLSRAEQTLKSQGVDLQKMYQWGACMQGCMIRFIETTAQALPGKMPNSMSSLHLTSAKTVYTDSAQACSKPASCGDTSKIFSSKFNFNDVLTRLSAENQARVQQTQQDEGILAAVRLLLVMIIEGFGTARMVGLGLLDRNSIWNSS